MSAIQTLKRELTKLQRAQSECVTNEGYVKNHCKYRYGILVEKAREIAASIKYLEELKGASV